MGQAWYVEDEQAYEEHQSLVIRRRRARRKMESVMRALDVKLNGDIFSAWQAVKCPFHDDRHASASVNLQKQFFRCHGCEVYGDALRIVEVGKGWDEEKTVTWILNST